MKKLILLITLLLIALPQGSFSEGLRDRFGEGGKLVYKISFNGIPSGTMEWQYLGKIVIAGKEAEALVINSDTKILAFLNLQGRDMIFLDSQSHLPLMVERDLVVFGKKEIIKEVYDQDEGTVEIKKTGDKKENQMLYPGKPIHNILSLLYFFPKNVELEKEKVFTFNLPTEKVKIEVVAIKDLSINGEKKETYFLKGSGAKRFNLWLDKEKRVPLRLEFLSIAGKLIIEKVFQTNS